MPKSSKKASLSSKLSQKKTAIIVVAILVVGLLGNRFLASQKQAPKKVNGQHQARLISPLIVKNKSIQPTITAFGTLKAKEKIQINAEVGGVLERRSVRFKEGREFVRGEILLQINADQTDYDLKSQKSQFLNSITKLIGDYKIDFPTRTQVWELYLGKFNIDDSLPPLPEISTRKEKYFLGARNILHQFYAIKSLEVKQSKYQIRAPFDGVVIDSQVEEGNLVQINQKLGTLI
ncbi:MAG: membrane fusion protein (multidrug efflux system), partial [Candidatus Marinamargulisbacteria bacterium]